MDEVARLLEDQTLAISGGGWNKIKGSRGG